MIKLLFNILFLIYYYINIIYLFFIKLICKNSKDANVPSLLCFFETGNESQANYCIKLRDNFQHEKTINYHIKSEESMPFAIKFKIKNKIIDIQTVFDDSENAMNQALQKMYSLLN